MGPRLPDIRDDGRKASVPSPRRARQHGRDGETDPVGPGRLRRKVQRRGESDLFAGEFMTCTGQMSKERNTITKHCVFFCFVFFLKTTVAEQKPKGQAGLPEFSREGCTISSFLQGNQFQNAGSGTCRTSI